MVVVPNNSQAQKKPKNPFVKQGFKYDEATDTYICPVGEEMFRANHIDERNRYEYRMRTPSSCRACIHFGTCTSSRAGRRLYRSIHEATRNELAKVYDSRQGQQVYERRKIRAEHPFGHIKRNLGAGAFLLRGLEGVNAEINLLGTCFNISRIITLLGGVRTAVTMLRQG